MAADYDRSNFKVNLEHGSAAMRRMQEIAQQIYDSTPGL